MVSERSQEVPKEVRPGLGGVERGAGPSVVLHPQFTECSLYARLDPHNRPPGQALLSSPLGRWGRPEAQSPQLTHPSPTASKEQKHV